MAAVVALNLAGCGAHFHNAEHHALAQEAKAAFDDAELANSFDAEYAAVEALSTAELEAALRQALALFNAQLVTILEGSDEAKSWGRLEGDIRERCTTLAANTVADTCTLSDELTNAMTLVEVRAKLVPSRQQAYAVAAAAAGQSEAKCDANGGATNKYEPTGDPSSDAIASRAYADLVKACKSLFEAQQALAASRGSGTGEIATLQQALEAITKFEAEADAALSELNKQYAQTQREQKGTLEHGPKDAKEQARKAITDGLSRFTEVTQAKAVYTPFGIVDISDLSLIGELGMIEEQLESISTLLSSELAPNQDATDDQLSEEQRLAFAGLTTIDAIAQLAKAGQSKHWKVPGPSVLLMTAQKLANDAAYLERKIERARTRKQLIEEQLAAATTELKFLSDAAEAYDTITADCRPLSSLSADFEGFKATPAKQACAGHTATALVAYGNAAVLGRAKVIAAQYQLIALAHLEAVDASQAAAKQWQALLEVPLSQLVAFEAAGITSDDVFKLLEVVGLGAIAGGVLK